MVQSHRRRRRSSKKSDEPARSLFSCNGGIARRIRHRQADTSRSFILSGIPKFPGLPRKHLVSPRSCKRHLRASWAQFPTFADSHSELNLKILQPI